MRLHVAAGVGLFALAFGVRWWLRQGLVLGDDPQEYAALLHILSSGPLLSDQLHVRFGGWIFNHLAFWLLGVSEATFLLPTALVTSTFGVLAYALLVRWGYGPLGAFLGGAMVALAPFEVVLGSLRANDSYLELALAVGFAGLVLLEHRPRAQGLVLAAALWFGFYVKLWVVFALPGLGLYFLAGRRWRALGAFVVASAVLHGATCAYWKAATGTFFPFFSAFAANYRVPSGELVDLFLKYPRLMFVGSFEFPTTLWGAVPYVLAALLAAKLVGAAAGATHPALRLDRADGLLLGFWGSFFLLMEFFPNGFTLDGYYSVPRIFRYLAPVSFPMALHAAKCVLDATRPVAMRPRAVAVAVVAPLLVLYVWQAVRANAPSSNYRRVFHEVLRDVQALRPPVLVAESIVASYFRDLYLDPVEHETEVVILHTEHAAADYERWLRAHEDGLRDGTMLITGLASFVHYGAHIDGFRLEWFERPLSPAWTLVREYDVLAFLPRPEPARLWRLERPAAATPAVPDAREDLAALAGVDETALFREGMARYDAGAYADARPWFRTVRDAARPESEDAAFFYAASFFREGRWPRARREFKRLLRRQPDGRWAPAAWWHIATAERNLGHNRRARRLYAAVVRRFPHDPSTVAMAQRDLDRLGRRRGGVLTRWWQSW